MNKLEIFLRTLKLAIDGWYAFFMAFIRIIIFILLAMLILESEHFIKRLNPNTHFSVSIDFLLHDRADDAEENE